MNTVEPAILEVKLYNGRWPIGEQVTLFLAGPTATLSGAGPARDYAADSLCVSPRVGGTERFIALPDGGQLQCPDHPALDLLPQEGRTEGMVASLERRWWVALGCLAALAAGLALGYRFCLPAAAERIAARIPIDYERQVGEQTVSWLDVNGFFRPSTLDPDVQRTIVKRFAELTHDLPLAGHYRLEFRTAQSIGPNALAFPGGIVVVTDQLVELSHTPEETLAVLAHEVGHIERRHVLRQLLQDSGSALLFVTFASDASSLSLTVSGLPILLVHAKYSREFETEADSYGFDLMQRRGISLESFASIVERLDAIDKGRMVSQWSFASTHPLTAERVARARAAAR